MAEQYNPVDFSTLSAVDDGKTLLYTDDKVCRSISSLGELINDKIGEKGYATETFVENEIGKVSNFIVTSGDDDGPYLDAEEAQTKSIYLIESGSGKDKYREWIATGEVGSKTWTCIGDTTLDLSDYAKTTYVNNVLALKEDKLTFAGENNTITSINTSAVGADPGQVLSAGTDLKIENDIVGVNTNGRAIGENSFVEGLNTYAGDLCDHVEGMGGIADNGGINHIEGFQYHSYASMSPFSDYYNSNKVKFTNVYNMTLRVGYGNTSMNGTLFELVKIFKEKFIVSCEYDDYSAPGEFHHTQNSFFKPKLYNILDVSLDPNDNNLMVITIDDTIGSTGYGSIMLYGPTSIVGVTSSKGPLVSGQTINTFTISGRLGFWGNGSKNIRVDNSFFGITLTYTESGESESTSIKKFIKILDIDYDASTRTFTFTTEDVVIPEITSGSYDLSLYVINPTYYGCNHIEGQDNAIINTSNSHAEGFYNTVTGNCSHAEGSYNLVLNSNAHAEGNYTIASGKCSHAEGSYTIANGNYSHAEGYSALANNPASHAEGSGTSALGDYSHAEGYLTSAKGGQSHAEGWMTSAYADQTHTEGAWTYAGKQGSHAEGFNTTANNIYAHSEGNYTIANGECSHAEGYKTSAIGDRAHAEGNQTIAQGNNAHAEGYLTSALEYNSHAEGYKTKANVYYAHAEGTETFADGQGSHAEGRNTSALGIGTHAEGNKTIAQGNNAHAEGQNTSAQGSYSHAEGCDTSAAGNYTHAEGSGTFANNEHSHAEGCGTTADNNDAHAEGKETLANGNASHAEGYRTSAKGDYSHAEGYETYTTASYAHAEGYNTIAGSDYMHAGGTCNATSANALFVIGNGTNTSNRSDALVLDNNGLLSAVNIANSGGVFPSIVTTATQPTNSTAVNWYIGADGKLYAVTAGNA